MNSCLFTHSRRALLLAFTLVLTGDGIHRALPLPRRSPAEVQVQALAPSEFCEAALASLSRRRPARNEGDVKVKVNAFWLVDGRQRSMSPPQRETFDEVVARTFRIAGNLKPPAVVTYQLDNFSEMTRRRKPMIYFEDGLGKLVVPDWIFGGNERYDGFYGTNRSRILAGTAVLSHETGHWIFDENVAQMPDGPFVRAWKSAWRKRQQATRELLESARRDPPAVSERRIFSVSAQEERPRERYRARTNDFMRLRMQFSVHAYQELFSDLLAVLVTDRADANAKALDALFGRARFAALWISPAMRYRDFNNGLRPRSMLKLDREELNDYYVHLAPVRGFIGRTYLPRIRTERQKQALLRQVFEAIVAELNARFDPRTGKARPWPVDRINQSLIDRIQATVKLP